MFRDELSILCRAGNGGDGSVHFAKRKYQPFGGPDGGDGGPGGDVVLRGERNVDNLIHLKVPNYQAVNGEPGGGNLMIGARGKDHHIDVPPGTLAYDAQTEAEIGSVCATGETLIVAEGGRGGRGNPRFASGQLRAPKTAEEGRLGQEREVLLRYRIYTDNVLIEPLEGDGLLLPELLGKPAAEVDFELYARRPRYVRCEVDWRNYDSSVMFIDPLAEAGAVLLRPEHLYWARYAFINLAPLGELAAEVWPLLWNQLLDLPLRRLERLLVAAPEELSKPAGLETEADELAQVEFKALSEPAEIGQAFHAGLTGEIVV